jgi:GxxExxY protein
MNGRTLLSMRICDAARLEGGMDDRKRLDTLTESIIGSAIEVHRALGPGLLESAYERCLSFDLATRGFTVEHQKPIPLFYKNTRLDCGYRVDLVVANEVIVEVKSVEQLLPIHGAQLLSYLRLSRLQVGLLINFNVSVLKNGLRRIVNSYPDFPYPLRASASSALKGNAS